MATIFIRHRVTDYGRWRRAYDDFDAERRGMGVTGQAVYQLAGDPNDLTVSHDFATIESARAFAASGRLREVNQMSGVASAPDIWFTERT
ncbi:MAG: cyclase [Chloroflexi bacterium]|nr:cyclase [Chloroflexota bacterium]